MCGHSCPSPCAICARRCARRQIYSQLQQLTFATKQQRTQAVEMIKQISELMVFADKHADALFECVPCPHPWAPVRAAAPSHMWMVGMGVRGPQLLL